MWECPYCGELNTDSQLVLQACRECEEPVRVYDNSGYGHDDRSSGWGTTFVVITILIAAIAYGPNVWHQAKEAFAEGTARISAIPELNFHSFDEQITKCIEKGGSPTYDTTRRYEFPFDEYTWTWELQLSTDIHKCLASPDIREGYGRFDYAQYVTARYDDQVMDKIIGQFREVQVQQGYDDRKLASMVLSFVQHLVYSADDVTTPYDEWPRFPLETLYIQGGDCEDTSILYASLIKAMGYSPALLAPFEHMAVGLPVERSTEGGVAYRGVFYAYAETTAEGYEIGDMPGVYDGAKIRVFEL